MFLLQTAKLDFYSPREGYYDESGRWVAPEEDVLIPQIRGSLQPFKETRERRRILPEGARADSTYIFYTRADVRTVSQYGMSTAWYAMIDGIKHYAYDRKNWARNGLFLDHYEVYLVREPLANPEDAGGL